MSDSESQASSRPASWRDLPRKDQLAVLAVCRVVDFLQIASFQTISYYQLKSFDPSLPEETLSWQTGVSQASFTASQFFTAILWGYIADSKWAGRKKVLLFGLVGTGLSCSALAFSKNFLSVAVFRALGGASNGTVGVVRTMISEVIKDRKHQSRAFLLLSASFALATIIGPVSAGWLADPAKSYPRFFGESKWLQAYPYALPSIFSASLLFLASIVVLLVLEETHKDIDAKSDTGTRLANYFYRRVTAKNTSENRGYISVASDEAVPLTVTTNSEDDTKNIGTSIHKQHPEPQLSFHRIWTSNVLLTMLSQAFFDFHLGAFGSMWPLLLSSPRDSNIPFQQFSLKLRGGLGMAPQHVGYAMAIMGFAGLIFQFVIYPRVHSRIGTLKCYRAFALSFPPVYAMSPFLVTVSGKNTAITWFYIAILLLLHINGRIFTIPASIMLLNNCSPHPSVLGVVHGIGQATSAAFRTIGPIFAGYLYGIGYTKGVIEISWWSISAISLVAWVASLFVREGSGHEIVLPGDWEVSDD